MEFEQHFMFVSRYGITFEVYLMRALQPMQLSCFLANFIMPLFEGVEMEIDLV